jgi:hypothetical protein
MSRSELAETIAQGDLTQDVAITSENDQLGHALKAMLNGNSQLTNEMS